MLLKVLDDLGPENNGLKGECQPRSVIEGRKRIAVILTGTATAEALRSFAAGTYERLWWVGYDSKNRPENLSGQPLDHKKAVFDAYGEEVLHKTTLNGHPVPPSAEEWRLWGVRSYFRLVASDKPDPDKPACK